MSWGFDDINCGGRLQVGTGIVPAIKEGDEKINGSMHCEGPAVFGGPTEFGDNVATLMVGRTKNDDKDCVPADRSLYVKGNTKLEGDDGTSNALYITGDTKHKGNIDAIGYEIRGDHLKGSISGGVSGKSAGAKAFDIIHPSKKGYRLRHICIEGPESAVFFRGRVKNDKIILLPEYWKDLVDINTITVQLQPIGAHQDIIVKRWDAEKIELQSKPGIPINCFYHIFAERKDIENLIVEYKGDSVDDYPGDNTIYSINK